MLMAGQQALRVKVTENGLRIREAPVNGKAIGQTNKDDILDVLDNADEARPKLGKKGQWVNVRKQDGTKGYVSAQFLILLEESTAATTTPAATTPASTTPAATTPASTTPTTPAASAKARLQPTTTLNLRSSMDTSSAANILNRLGSFDIIDIAEDSAAAQAKIGQKDQWIKVRTQGGQEGYVSAQYVQAFTGELPQYVLGARNLTGMNLDKNNPQGHPSPDMMKGIGWVRIKFNVSMNPDKPDGDPSRYGNTDIEAAYSRTKPFIEQYAKAGMKVLLVFTHQLYGEGAGFVWESMDSNRWNQLTTKYADMARKVAQKFVGSGLVQVYQIWNEQDTEAGKGRAAVPIPAKDYANMLTQTIRAIRSVDPSTLIITGGHARGPGIGGQYARETIAALPGDVRLDGLAVHPYGRGVAGNPYSNFGPLTEDLDVFTKIMPGKPIWYTEWGALGFQGQDDKSTGLADYAQGFVNIIKSPKYAGKVAAAMWYAWADGMDDGYGLVKSNGTPRDPLYSRFLKF
jgi:hypothetical protein